MNVVFRYRSLSLPLLLHSWSCHDVKYSLKGVFPEIDGELGALSASDKVSRSPARPIIQKQVETATLSRSE